MTDLPILFSAPMVRALLREIEQPGTGKTQTRRVLDMPPMAFDAVFNDDGVWHIGDATTGHYYAKLPVRCRVGDRLWVREAWRAQQAFDYLSPVEIGEEATSETGSPWCPVFYEADQRCDGSSVDIWQQSPPGRLRRGMHMPRWASRITLTVTEVRVQRLQDISEDDAIAEGIERCPHGNEDQWLDYPAGSSAAGWTDPRDSYRTLWDTLNAARGYGWDTNPWICAITFTPALGNIDEVRS